MAKYKVRGSTKTIELNQGNLKAKGGEGSIHIIGNVVYKVCDPGKMIPEGKFEELRKLNHPKIVKPENVILDSGNQAVGYTMNLVPGGARPLAQILSKTYQEREGVTPALKLELVRQMADGIRFIHKHPGYLQVDGNEFNYMVTDDYKDLYFIDVNSFQTPSYPADAIMPSIRDYHCPKDSNGLYVWSHNTDWYSFAIISFYMFTGIHPFKGKHPNFPNVKTFMIDQMKACKSVLDPEVVFPQAAVYFPFESVIPGGSSGAYMQWYKAVFIDNKRTPPPVDFQSVITFVQQVKEIVSSNLLIMQEIRSFEGQIVGHYTYGGQEVVVTTEKIYVANQGSMRPATKFRVGFTPVGCKPVAAWLEDGRLKLLNLESKIPIPCDVAGRNLMSYDGRLYLQSEKNILEITFIEMGNTLMAASNSVADIMPEATELFQGVAFQDMFGVKMASMFPQSGHHRSCKIDELAGYNITEAKLERNVLMVIGSDKKSGEYTRFIFRFGDNWQGYDVRKVENIVPSGINFTVLDNGVCVCITEEEKVEIFASQKDSAGVKSIVDPSVKANMRLCHSGPQVRFAMDNKLFNFSVKK